MPLQCKILEINGFDVNGYYKKALMITVPEYIKACKKLNIKGALKKNLEIVIDNIKDKGVLDINNHNIELAGARGYR